jgi:hypothetical protein
VLAAINNKIKSLEKVINLVFEAQSDTQKESSSRKEGGGRVSFVVKQLSDLQIVRKN